MAETMNATLETVFIFLQQVKAATKAQYVRFSTSPYGMKMYLEWDDDSKYSYALGIEEIRSANYLIIDELIKKINHEHDEWIKKQAAQA